MPLVAISVWPWKLPNKGFTNLWFKSRKMCSVVATCVKLWPDCILEPRLAQEQFIWDYEFIDTLRNGSLDLSLSFYECNTTLAPPGESKGRQYEDHQQQEDKTFAHNCMVQCRPATRSKVIRICMIHILYIYIYKIVHHMGKVCQSKDWIR